MKLNLYNADCFEAFKELEEQSVDMVCVDPPYGTTTISWDETLDFNRMWKELDRVCKEDANIVMFGSQPFSSLLICSNIKNFKYELIWNKNKCGSPGLAKYRPNKVHENIMIFNKKTGIYNPIMEKGQAYIREAKDKENGYGSQRNSHGYGFGKKVVTSFSNEGTRYPKSILHSSRNFSAQQTVHPTQKPVSILCWLIMTYSNKGDTVLDFTMGSGSCGVAAKMTERNFIGIEQDSEYFKICEKRINSIDNSEIITPDDFLLTTQISDQMKTTPDKKFSDNSVLDKIRGKSKKEQSKDNVLFNYLESS
jgi:site-specific DNA-methyltransferase (adenine-specific)